MSLVQQVRVNHVADKEAPAIVRTRISFSIPRMESANLGHRQEGEQYQSVSSENRRPQNGRGGHGVWGIG